jgi:hypothetical protein
VLNEAAGGKAACWARRIVSISADRSALGQGILVTKTRLLWKGFEWARAGLLAGAE